MKSLSITYFNRLYITILLSLIFSMSSRSQISPGGVSSEIHLWLKADSGAYRTASSYKVGTNLAVNGDAVNAWKDLSGNRTNDATSTGLGTPPMYLNNDTANINYNPVVYFDGIDDGLDYYDDFPSIPSSKSGVSIYTVCVPTHKDSTASGARIIEVGAPLTHGLGLTVSPELISFYSPRDFGGKRLASSMSYKQQAVLVSGTMDFGFKQSLVLDGELVSSSAITLNEISMSNIAFNKDHLSGSGPLTIGRQAKNGGLYSNPERLFKGTLSEIIVFAASLTNTQHQKVQSYLAIKYGITLSHDLVASDGMRIWDADNGFNNSLLVIGRDDNSNLNQRQSKSQSPEAILTVGLAEIASSNTNNSSFFSTDYSFLAIGHNGNSAFETTMDIPKNVTARLDREWKVANINNVGEVAIQLDTRGLGIVSDELNLIFDLDGDGDFSTGEIKRHLPDSISNSKVYYSNVKFSDGVVFTFTTEWVKPAGITDAVVWLKAENNAYSDYDGQRNGTALATHNDPVLSWKDISGHRKYDAVTDYKIPAYYKSDSAESINFRPALYFPGDSSGFTFYDDYVYGVNDGITVFAVVAGEDAGEAVKRGRSHVFGMGKHGNKGYGGTWGYDTAFIYSANTTDINHVYANPKLRNTPSLVKYEFEFDGNNSLYGNSELLAQKVNFISELSDTEIWEHPTHAYGKGPYSIGRQSKDGRLYDAASGPRLFKGYMAEIIQFDRLLTDIETQKVQSYLGMKYGLPLGSPANPFTYILSDGSEAWTGNVTYQNNIFGIFRDDEYQIEQKQSTSGGSGGIHAIGLGEVAENNAANSSTISMDLSALFIGNNGLLLTEIDSELPAEIHNRLSREWLVQQTGTIGSVDIAFDLSDITVSAMGKEDFRLLIDTDGDADFTTGTITYVTPASYHGGVVLFDDVNFGDGDVFSIGTLMNSSPYVSSSAVTSVDFESTYSYAISSTDDETDGITITAPILPSWLTLVDNSDGTAYLSGNPDCGDAGTHQVVIKVADYELDSTHTFNIVVGGTDITDPVISDIPSNISVNSDPSSDQAIVNWVEPTADDNCSVSSFISDFSSNSEFDIGVTAVTYTAEDPTGNKATGSFTITVTDNENPTITCPTTVTVNTDAGLSTASIVTLGSAITADNDGVASVSNDAPATFLLGSTTVTWTVTDNAGNTATCTQIVTVTDTENPTISCPIDMTASTDVGENFATVAIGSATTTDNNGVASVTNDAPATFPIGTTIVAWVVTDHEGNAVTCTQTITVTDNQAPTINCPADFSVDTDEGLDTVSGVVLETATATDNGMIISINNNAPGIFNLGINNVTWSATDNNGNIETCIQTITVIDNQEPEITCPADVIVDTDPGGASANEVELGAPFATDNSGVQSIYNSVLETYPGGFQLGNTSITWTAEDMAGNTATCEQMVTVIDQEAPEIHCPESVYVLLEPGTLSIADVYIGVAVATDNVLVDNLFNDAPMEYYIGDTTVNWFAIDAAGNTSTCAQKIFVSVENSAPMFASIPVLTVDEDVNYRYDIVVFDQDNDAVTIQAISIPSWMELSNGSFPVLTGLPTNDRVGSHNVELHVTDGNKYSIQQFEIIVSNTNDAPIAQDDYFEYSEMGKASYVDVLANDYDVDFGDALEILKATTENGQQFPIDNNRVVVQFDQPPLSTVIINYSVTDNNGAIVEGHLEVGIILEDQVLVSQGFSPNGDGINDYWHIQGIENFPDNVVEIYNKWGDRVASIEGYNNSSNHWSGESKYNLVDGVYLYAISTVKDKKQIKGFIYLNR